MSQVLRFILAGEQPSTSGRKRFWLPLLHLSIKERRTDRPASSSGGLVVPPVPGKQDPLRAGQGACPLELRILRVHEEGVLRLLSQRPDE